MAPFHDSCKIESLIRLQSFLIDADEVKSLKIGFVNNTKSRNRMLKKINMYCRTQNFTFGFDNTNRSFKQHLNCSDEQEQMNWLECYLYLSLIQTLNIRKITSLYIFDGNNIFLEKPKTLSFKNMNEITQLMENATKQYKDIFTVYVFDNSILKLVRDNPEFEEMYRKYPMIIIRRGMEADEIILYIYSLLNRMYDIKIISRDKYRDYRDRYDFDSYDLIAIKNPKQIKRYLKDRMLLEEI